MADDPSAGPPRVRPAYLRHLRHKLGAGLLVVVPVGITIFILRFLFRLADGFLAPYIIRLGKYVGEDYFPGLGVLTGAVVVYLAGLLATNVFGRRLLHAWESFLSRIPLVKSVYLAAKQVMEIFAGREKNAFRQAVYVDFPLEGSFAIGFVTGEMVTASGKHYLTCFVPTAPNPTSGFVLVLEDKEVYPAGISVEEAMRIIVSGGMVAPECLGMSRLR